MKRLLPLLLILALLLPGCGPRQGAVTPTPTPAPESASPSAAPDTPTPSATPAPTESAPPQTAERVRLAVLSGPTGVGAAKLMADNDAGTSRLSYDVTVAADNTQVTAGLINGDFDIAAIATNVASNLYWKTDGGVQLAAVNTLGVLYILGGEGQRADSLADLRGKTVYATGKGANPEYVLRYLLRESGVDPDNDVTIEWKAPEEITAAMLQGQAELCMLPVPAATALIAKSEGKVRELISLSDAWAELRGTSQLTMGCVVVRTGFAQEHPQLVNDFLEEYAVSIEAVRSDPAGFAQTVADYGITPSAGIAAKAIPQCNLVCVRGDEARELIQSYYEVLYQADPASIGGGIPDDGFFYLGE